VTEDLARRAIVCPGWQWMPGMRCTDGNRMLCAGDDLDGDWQAWIYEDYDSCACKVRPYQARDDIPDLTDPATLGCLLALVREALDMPYLCTSVSPEGRWWVDGYSLHDTEAEALVAALEAAP